MPDNFDKFKYEEIDLTFLHGTDSALLLSDGDIEAWIPVSLISDPDPWHYYMTGNTYTFEIKEWILLQQGLI